MISKLILVTQINFGSVIILASITFSRRYSGEYISSFCSLGTLILCTLEETGFYFPWVVEFVLYMVWFYTFILQFSLGHDFWIDCILSSHSLPLMTVPNLLGNDWLFTICSLWLQLFGTSPPNRDYKPFGKKAILPCLWYLTQRNILHCWWKACNFTFQYKWKMINSMHVSLQPELFPLPVLFDLFIQSVLNMG